MADKRESNGKFKKGWGGGPGRPKGSRSIAVEIIFKLFHEQAEKFEEKMRIRAEEDPIVFYQDFVEPLQPKETNLNLDSTEPIQIQIVTTVKKPRAKDK